MTAARKSMSFYSRGSGGREMSARKIREMLRAAKETTAAQTTARRPNQNVVSFSDMSVTEREELAVMLEAELARL